MKNVQELLLLRRSNMSEVFLLLLNITERESVLYLQKVSALHSSQNWIELSLFNKVQNH